MSDTELCIECNNIVRPRQDAITCDVCDKWQNRICSSGWHRKLNYKAGRGDLQLYVLVKLLLEEAKLVTLQVQMVSEETLSRHRRQLYVSMDKKIFDLWDMYDSKDIVCEDFLKSVGEVYGRF